MYSSTLCFASATYNASSSFNKKKTLENTTKSYKNTAAPFLRKNQYQLIKQTLLIGSFDA
jgi:hypothetical protein